jgi:hypothetical protein
MAHTVVSRVSALALVHAVDYIGAELIEHRDHLDDLSAVIHDLEHDGLDPERLQELKAEYDHSTTAYHRLVADWLRLDAHIRPARRRVGTPSPRTAPRVRVRRRGAGRPRARRSARRSSERSGDSPDEPPAAGVACLRPGLWR